jgi:hypothetical protein
MPDVAQQPSRKRLIAFGVLAVLFGLAAVAPRPFMAPMIVTLWAGDAGEMRSHELHGIINSFLLWSTVVAVALHGMRRHRATVGALWALMIIGVLPLVGMLALSGVPAEFIPIVAVILVMGIALFFVHPVPLRDKVRSAHGVSPVLLGLAAVAAIPLLAFASGQYSMHLQAISGDQHHEFGHWLAMGSFALSISALAFITAARVSGYKTAGWFVVVATSLYAVGSLVLPAVHGSVVTSPWGTIWALAALAWAAGFAVVMTRNVEATAPTIRPAVAPS